MEADEITITSITWADDSKVLYSVLLQWGKPVGTLLTASPQARRTPMSHTRRSGGDQGDDQVKEAKKDCCWCWTR